MAVDSLTGRTYQSVGDHDPGFLERCRELAKQRRSWQLRVCEACGALTMHLWLHIEAGGQRPYGSLVQRCALCDQHTTR